MTRDLMERRRMFWTCYSPLLSHKSFPWQLSGSQFITNLICYCISEGNKWTSLQTMSIWSWLIPIVVWKYSSFTSLDFLSLITCLLHDNIPHYIRVRHHVCSDSNTQNKSAAPTHSTQNSKRSLVSQYQDPPDFQLILGFIDLIRDGISIKFSR